MGIKYLAKGQTHNNRRDKLSCETLANRRANQSRYEANSSTQILLGFGLH